MPNPVDISEFCECFITETVSQIDKWTTKSEYHIVILCGGEPTYPVSVKIERGAFFKLKNHSVPTSVLSTIK